jgi:copper(I)-binding protein
MRVLVLAVLIGAARVAMAEVTVADPWVRGTVEGQTSTVAYMTLKSDTAVRLVSVSSPAAAHCSVHETTISGDLMKMRTLEALPIPAGAAVVLEQGHDHLMLEGLVHPLKEGDTVRLTLTLVDSGGKRQTVDVSAPVVPLGAAHGGLPHHPTPMTR